MRSLSTRLALLGAASAATLGWSAAASAQTTGEAGPTASPPAAQQPTSPGSSQASPQVDRLPGAPPAAQGSATPAPDTAVATAPPETTGPEVVVRGVRGAQQAAINVKRNASQIVDSIVAEDIGKLPDTTIADSLQRVPGVQIDRSAGEGSGVNIRGIPQVLTTFNGEVFLDGGINAVGVGSNGQVTGGGGLTSAQPSLEDVPPALFAGVDVIKSPTADQISGGISGILGLKTFRPFDLHRGLTLTGSAQGDYATELGHGNQQYSGLASYNAGKFGALFAFSYTTEMLANYHPNVGYQDVPAPSANLGFNPSGGTTLSASTALGSGNYVYQPVYYELNNQTTDRQRLGLNSSLQYRFTDALTLTVDLAYLHLDNRNRSQGVETQTNGALNVLQPGAIVSSQGYLINGDDLLNHYQSHAENDFANSDAGDTSFLLTYDNHGRFRASLRYVGDLAVQRTSNAFADNLGTTFLPGAVARSPGGAAVSVNPQGVATTNIPSPIPGSTQTQTAASGVLVNVQPSGDYPQLNFITNVSDPNLYNMQSIWGQGTNTYAQINVVRGDAAYDVDWGPLRTIEMGGRYSDRKVKFQAWQYEAPIGGTGTNNLYYYKDSLISDANYGYSIVPIYHFSSLPAGYVSLAKIKGVNQLIPTINVNAMDNAKAFLDTFFPGNVAYDDPAQGYTVTEKETSGYVQGDFEGDTPYLGWRWRGNAGVRIVNTDLNIFNQIPGPNYIGSSGSYNGVLIPIGTQDVTNSYTDVLPAVNVSFDVTQDQKLRFAYNKAVARQDLGTLGQPLKSYYIENGGRIANEPASLQLFSSGSVGNPNLDPFRSDNYQASYEWYFHKSSLLSAAIFYIDVASFPVSATQFELEPDADGVARLGGNVSTTINGGGGSIKGLELGYEQALDFLPGFLSGFGIQANATYADSETSNIDSAGHHEPLPNNSRYQVNGILTYQKGPWQGRIAYNWRSSQFAAQYSSGTQNLGVYAEPIGFLDAGVSYDVNRHLTIFTQATNITGSDQKRYLEWPGNFYDENVYETRVFLGVRLRN